MKHLFLAFFCAGLGACASTDSHADGIDGDGHSTTAEIAPSAAPGAASNAHIGALSVSLSVKDIAASAEFYGHLGFEPFMGDPAQNWQMLRNGDHVIGLFQGLFPKNTLTFNPGWDQQAAPMSEFRDVRDIQAALKAAGVPLVMEADADSTGPASLMLMDPDGNPVLIDQHVPKP